MENFTTDSKISPLTADVDIAIIDSGIDLDHPDLNVYRSITSIVPQNNSSSSLNNTLINSNIDREKIGVDTRDDRHGTGIFRSSIF